MKFASEMYIHFCIIHPLNQHPSVVVSSYILICAFSLSLEMGYFRYNFEHKFLDDVARKICNSVRGVNRVVQDITSKPPSTIEWE